MNVNMFISAVIQVLLAFQCSAKTLSLDNFDIPLNAHILQDDIRIAPEQEQMIKEKGFYTPGKWKMNNGVVTVPYYFDDYTVSRASPLRKNFELAAKIYEEQTCIQWVQTTKSDRRRKVKVFAGRGCYSQVGMLQRQDNVMSLEKGCDEVSVIIHEMGHAMGLQHTQCRRDRDKFVKIWTSNVEQGMEHNFNIAPGDLYNVPYDYKSMMHYGYNYFSTNGRFTLTTNNPFALFSIGQYPKTFRWSDAAFLNRGYGCDAIFAAKCPDVRCQNNGYVGKDCKCKCPENTKGLNCETVTGDLFDDVVKCGGLVNTTGVIMSEGYGQASTADKCIFVITAPKCKVPSITITQAKFYTNNCRWNMLSLQVSKKNSGNTYCSTSKTPIGKPILSEGNTAVLYYFTMVTGFRDLGFNATIKFMEDPSCSKG